ncbi:MAG: pyocin knob domain-containing protein, partial [Betaproteobacteria bacterium]
QHCEGVIMSLTARITALAQAVGADIKTTLAHIGSRGSAHGVATTSEAGFLSATDKTKLDSMSAGASGDANAAMAAHIAEWEPHGLKYPLTPSGYAVLITGSDLNTAYRTGFFRGDALINAPNGNTGWWYVLVQSHHEQWVKQTATAFGSGNYAGEIYERVCNEGVWTSWAKVFKQGAAIDAPNLIISRGTNPTTNWNTLTSPGIYGIGYADLATVANSPSGAYGFGLLHVTTSAQIVSQRYVTHHGVQFVREKWNADDWFSWSRTLSSSTDLYAAAMNQYVRTTDSVRFAAISAGTGLVDTATTVPGDDWNNAVQTGAYMGLNFANAPTAGVWYMGNVVAHNTSYVTQEVWLFTDTVAVPRFRRMRFAGAWSAWVSTGSWSASGLSVAGNVSGTNGYFAETLTVGSGNSYGYHSIINLKAPYYVGSLVLDVGSYSAMFHTVYNPANGGSSAALALGHSQTSLRSLDATGTINASGADYAEHEYNNGNKIIKGQIVGFDSDGMLTTQFGDAMRFAVKSTEPGYTGGNTWMAGLPDNPNMPALQRVERPNYGEADDVNRDAEVDAAIEQEYQDALVAAEIEYQAALAQYKRDKAIFDAAMQEAVSKVDRIAYCGKVPVNYIGAEPGQYLIAKATADDGIGCYAVYDPTFQEYLRCIGRVNKVLPDGRAEIAVIIH